MADVSRRGFLGFLSLLPVAGKATAPAVVEPKPFKFYGLFLKVPAYVTDRTVWLRKNTAMLAPSQGAVSFTMPCCKREMRYTKISLIPTRTVQCPCGTPDRWITFWEVDTAAINTEPGRIRWVPDCKTCNGTKVILTPLHWPSPDARAYLKKDCPDCTEMKPRKSQPLDLYWDTNSNALYSRPLGTVLPWKKTEVS